MVWSKIQILRIQRDIKRKTVISLILLKNPFRIKFDKSKAMIAKNQASQALKIILIMTHTRKLMLTI